MLDAVQSAILVSQGSMDLSDGNGIDTVFLVWTAPSAAGAPALARIAKHARRVVFLSAPLKRRTPSSNSPILPGNWPKVSGG
ncbi:MAG: hypothetical protein HYX27_19190 [Acidobacteria bacterium]|nr:hypothetical protein [Acidobacteriota bacterium]